MWYREHRGALRSDSVVVRSQAVSRCKDGRQVLVSRVAPGLNQLRRCDEAANYGSAKSTK